MVARKRTYPRPRPGIFPHNGPDNALPPATGFRPERNTKKRKSEKVPQEMHHTLVFFAYLYILIIVTS